MDWTRLFLVIIYIFSHFSGVAFVCFIWFSLRIIYKYFISLDHILYVYLSLKPLHLKGAIIRKKKYILLKGNIPSKEIIYYKKHTLKRDKTCQKPYPWGLNISILQYIVPPPPDKVNLFKHNKTAHVKCHFLTWQQLMSHSSNKFQYFHRIPTKTKSVYTIWQSSHQSVSLL